MEQTAKLYKLYAELTVVGKAKWNLRPAAPTPGSDYKGVPEMSPMLLRR